jgi:hypothetical protein
MLCSQEMRAPLFDFAQKLDNHQNVSFPASVALPGYFPFLRYQCSQFDRSIDKANWNAGDYVTISLNVK